MGTLHFKPEFKSQFNWVKVKAYYLGPNGSHTNAAGGQGIPLNVRRQWRASQKEATVEFDEQRDFSLEPPIRDTIRLGTVFKALTAVVSNGSTGKGHHARGEAR